MMEDIRFVYKYSRSEAIADRVLIDVNHVASEYGIALSTVFTISLFMVVTENLDASVGRSEANVHAVFRALRTATDHLTAKADTVHFQVAFDSGKHLGLWTKCHPGDAGEPVVTIMLADED
jgi:hypothetical protein